MILIALLAFSFFFVIIFTKCYEREYGYIILILFFLALLLIGIIGMYLNSKKRDVENYQQELQEIKAQQYDLIKNSTNAEKIQKNEKKIVEITEKYNEKAKIYNKILYRANSRR